MSSRIILAHLQPNVSSLFLYPIFTIILAFIYIKINRVFLLINITLMQERVLMNNRNLLCTVRARNSVR